MTEYAVESGYLVEVVNEHTCGAGGDMGHEPTCGMVPVAPIADLLADGAKIAAVRRVLTERAFYIPSQYEQDALIYVDSVRAVLEDPEGCCGHTAAEHGLRRCMALLESSEPCPCGKGYRP